MELSHTSKGVLHNASTVLNDRGIEVLALQEVDRYQVRSGEIDQVAAFAESLSARDWAFAPTLIGTPGESWRSLTSEDQRIFTSKSVGAKRSKKDADIHEPSYGIGLISKIPVKQWHRCELGRSLVGLPLLFPNPEALRTVDDLSENAEGIKTEKLSPSKSSIFKSVRFIYVRDEPRVALVAELENGYTVVVTHLSFVPFVNFFQLIKIKRWLKKLPGEKIIVGDLNLGWGLPVRGTHWRSLNVKNTYPAWDPKIQFDYITAHIPTFGERHFTPIEIPELGMSDHLPLGVEIH